MAKQIATTNVVKLGCHAQVKTKMKVKIKVKTKVKLKVKIKTQKKTKNFTMIGHHRGQAS